MTDDRRALAERLAQRVFDKYRQGQEERYDALAEQPSHDRERAILCVLAGLSHRDPHAEREAAKQAWDAAVRCTGVTSSYASARDRYLAATYPTEPPCETLSDGSVVTRRIASNDEELDRLIAAVRAAERDRCIAVVEKAQRYEGETRFGLSGHTMERNEWGDWLDRDSTLAALRGTEEAPDGR